MQIYILRLEKTMGAVRGASRAVVVMLLAAVCSAANVHRQKRAALACAADQTEILTPYLTSSQDKCPDLINAVADFYNEDFRNECKRWLGLNHVPERIEDSYVSFCKDLDSGEAMYRARVCCGGATTVQKCFTCSDSSPQYDRDVDPSMWPSYRHTEACNYGPESIQTCGQGEVCMTTSDHAGSASYNYGLITKQCASNAVCEAKKDDNKCRSRIPDPSCTECCDTPFCNFAHQIHYLSPGDACQPNPCLYNGVCINDPSNENGYTCQCSEGTWGDSCRSTVCNTETPCKNSGYCYRLVASPYYTCTCRAAWKGINCTEGCRLCHTNPCQNGGSCYDRGTTYGDRCVCPDGYVGKFCEMKRPLQCSSESNYYIISSSPHQKPTYDCTSYDAYILQMYIRSYVSTCNIVLPTRYGNQRYVAGIHGQTLETVDAIGMNTCEKGDEHIFLQFGMCCPACSSNPCQNGGYCQQTEDGSFRCKCRYGYGGERCEFKQAVCYVSGDPHYNTFDGKMIHFQGKCKYNMASAKEESSIQQFQVYVRNEERNGVTSVTYTKYVEINVWDVTIKLDRHKKVYVNGVKVAAGYNQAERFTISVNGRFIRFESVFGLVVDSDGEWLSIVKIPTDYNNQVDGLCADYNGNPGNDLTTSGGLDVSEDPNKYTVYGNSWQVDDPTDPMCTSPNEDPPECSSALAAVVKSNTYCGLIVDESANNPFKPCINAAESDSAGFMENCEYDVCANQPDTDLMKEAACNSLNAFAAKCQDLGIVVDWRAAAGCELDCGVGEYQRTGSACPASCSNPNAPQECTFPDTEVCICPDGQLLEEDKCIDPSECGCIDMSGVRHEIGGNWVNDDCTVEYTCEECTGVECESVGVITNTSFSCSNNQVCNLVDGKHECVHTNCIGDDGRMHEIGVQWLNNACTIRYTCLPGSTINQEGFSCQANEKCALMNGDYGCVLDGCIDATNGAVHQFNDVWLSDGCTVQNFCNIDGTITRTNYGSGGCGAMKCVNEVCVPHTCFDTRGTERQVGDQWIRDDCLFYVVCTPIGIETTRAYGCPGAQVCEARDEFDLAQCVDPPCMWSDWSDWEGCDGRCGTGIQTRTRVMIPPDAMSCQGHAQERRDCQCGYNFSTQDCDNCKLEGGSEDLGYLEDPCNCMHFYQCERSSSSHTGWKAYHRKCAPCTEWSQDIVTCIHTQEPCVSQGGGIDTQVAHVGATCIRSGNAEKQVDSDPTRFKLKVYGRWMSMACPQGTKFDLHACDCMNDPNAIINTNIEPITCLQFTATSVRGTRGYYAVGTAVHLMLESLNGYAAYFNGHAYIEIPYFTNGYNRLNQFTVSLWFKPDGTTGNQQGLLSNGWECEQDVPEEASIKILYGTSGVSASIQTKPTTRGSVIEDTVGGVMATANAWHHLVYTYTGSRLNVYLDGQLHSGSKVLKGGINERHCPIVLGIAGPNMGFEGYMDEVCFYDVAFNQADVLAMQSVAPVS